MYDSVASKLYCLDQCRVCIGGQPSDLQVTLTSAVQLTFRGDQNQPKTMCDSYLWSSHPVALKSNQFEGMTVSNTMAA